MIWTVKKSCRAELPGQPWMAEVWNGVQKAAFLDNVFLDGKPIPVWKATDGQLICAAEAEIDRVRCSKPD